MAANPRNPPEKLNMDPSPCNESAERRNWTKLSNLDDGIKTDQLWAGAFFDLDGELRYQDGKFYGDFIYNGVSLGEDLGKVKVNDVDEKEFLKDKFTFVLDPPEFAAGDLQVKHDLNDSPANPRLDSFIPVTTFDGYNGAERQVFGHNAQVFELRTTTEITVVTDYRVDDATMKLQKKTRAVTVIAAAAESDWTDVHTGTDECPE